MRRRTRQAAPPKSGRPDWQHQPFRQLAAHVKPPPRPQAPARRPPVVQDPPAAPVPVSDADLFRQEMADVRPLPSTKRVPQPRAHSPRPIADADADVVAELAMLVGGSGSFDLSDTTELIEGAVVGLDRRLLRRLRRGEFAYQSHIDLHGMTSEQARAAVDQFLAQAHQRGHQCVLIVHGRGLNSKDQIPVLKTRLATWLARGSWARLVLAFTSARQCDGGAGALYVLLRRQRHTKLPIRVTQGAKW